jgi:hypothetical protein
MTPTLATTTVRLAHRVRLRHTATGEVIEPVQARGVLPYGWAMRVRGGDVVVTTRDGAPVPAAAPVITVTVGDLRLAALVQTPTVDVPLGAAEITVDVAPVPMTLDVELSTPTSGVPRTGRTVTARATSGPTPRPTVPLPESAPGVYGSGPVVWTAAFTPLDLLVDGDLLRQLAVDHTRSATRVRLVDTT